jgi:uncharacterized protein
MEKVTITKEPTRYVLFIGELEAGFADWQPVTMHDERFIELPHTVTNPPFRGRGVARLLVTHILDELLEAQTRVIPSCPYVADLIRENEHYHPLLARPSA